MLALAACGGSSSYSRSPTARTEPSGAATTAQTPVPAAPTSDELLAASKLIRRGDLPSDWLEAQTKTHHDEDILGAACPEAAAGTPTARVTSSDYLFDGDSPALSEIVSVFADEQAARASIDAAGARGDCFADAVNRGLVMRRDVTLSDAKSVVIAVDTGGDSTRAFEIRGLVSRAGSQAPQAVTLYTLVFSSVGRVACEVFIRGNGDSLDSEDVSALASAAVARVRGH